MFNEDTRVKLPALVHLTRLGCKYISRSEAKQQSDPETNILKTIQNGNPEDNLSNLPEYD